MREIKFRAQRADTKMWIYSTGYYHDKINYWFVLPNEENSAIHFSNKRIININTLGQFTGLKDKNDKEIYEGDIVKMHSGDIPPKEPFILEVGFNTDRGYFGLCFDKGEISRFWSNKEQWEVLGNIYEDKELLK